MSNPPIATLTRCFQTDKVTLGMLQFKGLEHDPIYTVENPWRNNKPVASCIPADSYLCTPYSGQRYKDVWILEGVPGRSAILIHYGNTEKDTDGCILVGLGGGMLGKDPAVLESKKALEYLRLLVGRKQFIMIIK